MTQSYAGFIYIALGLESWLQESLWIPCHRLSWVTLLDDMSVQLLVNTVALASIV